ncbi:hypothetical protein ACIBJE_15980 [Micromonospora sp. NPDC050187]|uniref:hypothetical protein n=1 Tax=Micromonospora sp. NPDC050187 TaxID=3364277 RepID=UPI0037B6C1F8
MNTCFAFANGTPLGSVLLDPGPLRDRVTDFAARCLDTLELVDGPFHLELFHTPGDELASTAPTRSRYGATCAGPSSATG